MEILEPRWARSGDVDIACQVLGDGPVDLVCCPPFASNVGLVRELAPRHASNEGLGSVAREIAFDRRGTGL